jgi:L-ascorbate metabolism protein UlaG (beta-lactamase superfamily)
MSTPDRGSVLFIGTATTLIRYGGFTLLTDPNFLHRGQRASLGYGLWSRRLTEPALDVSALPPLDGVVLSHLHGDHFDRRARRGLDHDVPVLTTRHAASVLRRFGFRQATALATWEATTLERDGSRVTVTSLPGLHARGLMRGLLPPVMGSLLLFEPADESPPLRIYITGDTMVTERLHEIRRRYPRPDVGLIHLGGTRILGALVTPDGKEGVDLLDRVPVDVVVPIHLDDYGVFRSPPSDFAAEMARRKPEADVRWLARGDALPLPVPPPP